MLPGIAWQAGPDEVGRAAVWRVEAWLGMAGTEPGDDEPMRCSICDSDALVGVEDYGPTGVTHPDGGQEYRMWIGYRCLTCGCIEEI